VSINPGNPKVDTMEKANQVIMIAKEGGGKGNTNTVHQGTSPETLVEQDASKDVIKDWAMEVYQGLATEKRGGGGLKKMMAFQTLT
jgi:hypothetical protein